MQRYSDCLAIMLKLFLVSWGRKRDCNSATKFMLAHLILQFYWAPSCFWIGDIHWSRNQILRQDICSLKIKLGKICKSVWQKLKSSVFLLFMLRVRSRFSHGMRRCCWKAYVPEENLWSSQHWTPYFRFRSEKQINVGDQPWNK